MAQISDRHQPSFILWPLQNARTAWQAVYLPVILFVPHRRNSNGTTILNTEAFDVTFRIEDAQNRIPVAGEDYRGLLVPNFDLFKRELSTYELETRRIDVQHQDFINPKLFDYVERDFNRKITLEEFLASASKIDQETFNLLDVDSDGQLTESDFNQIDVRKNGFITFSNFVKSYDSVEINDLMIITTEAGKLRDVITWYADADYFDLSTISIETYLLQPPGKYVFSWTAHYYGRILTDRGELFCIDENGIRLARLPIVFDHPGDVFYEMQTKMPDYVFTGERIDKDQTLKFIRPYSDILQDVYDEASFLQKINHIDYIPASYIPYLSYLLGWSLPYFPGSTDTMRRNVLKNARKLQNLKGSKAALRDLFEIFNYAIDIINVWYSPDGKKLLAPNDPAPNVSYKINQKQVVRSDPMVSNYNADGFGSLEIPLLYHPTGDITIEAWIVKTSSALYEPLKGAVDSWDSLEADAIGEDPEGYLVNPALYELLPSGAAVGYSQVLVSQQFGGIDSRVPINSTQTPINQYGAKYDKYRNTLTLTFDHYIEFKPDEKLFIFATYERSKIEIPEELTDLRSNRFDIKILSKLDGSEVDPRVLEHLFDFITDLKAFHSLLRKIAFTLNYASVYNVTDFCVGQDRLAEPGTIMGEAQVPPAIIPKTINLDNCVEGAFNRGFKVEDLKYRENVIQGLQEEFQAWKDLDCTHKIPSDQQALIESLSRLSINPESMQDCSSCESTKYGQDRKYFEEFDQDHETDPRQTACDISSPIAPYCYTGRVKDQVQSFPIVRMNDTWKFSSCELMMGNDGFYFEMPVKVNISQPIRFDQIKNINRSLLEGRLVRSLAFNQKLQFTQEHHLSSRVFNGLSQFNLNMPQLGIQKDNMFIPGHRYITMDKLEIDFTHDVWSLRPWDDASNCANVSSMFWTMEVDTEGNEILVFDTEPLVYLGNGLISDVSSLSSHDAGTTVSFVTHSIYTNEISHEAIQNNDSLIEVDATAGDTACLGSEVQGPIFDSAAPST